MVQPLIGGGGLGLRDLEDVELRLPRIDALLDLHKDEPIGALQALQRELGFLPANVLPRAALALDVPLARLYGLATFYESLRLQPLGRQLLRVCRGTACHVSGAPEITARLEAHLRIKTGETTADGALTLQSAACLGCCSLAPVAASEDQTWGRLDADAAVALADELRSEP